MSKHDKVLQDVMSGKRDSNISFNELCNLLKHMGLNLERISGSHHIVKMDAKYEVIIWWSKEDNCYLAEVPELAGCMADGETLSEVAAAVEESMRLWIEVNRERGIEIPEPKGKLMYA